MRRDQSGTISSLELGDALRALKVMRNRQKWTTAAIVFLVLFLIIMLLGNFGLSASRPASLPSISHATTHSPQWHAVTRASCLLP